MSAFSDNAFDKVVAFGGPISYVLDQREKAISECIRVVKPGGLIILGVMSLWGAIHRFLDGVLGFTDSENDLIIRTGDLTNSNSKFASHFSHMLRSAELRTFLESPELNVLEMSASSTLSAVHSDNLELIMKDQDKWNQLVKMEIQACREPGLLDSGTHLIAVARKAI